jgi:UDP-GlcNAc:undecaprenyl-phosphate GlcNAc-1-phosphate transferase
VIISLSAFLTHLAFAAAIFILSAALTWFMMRRVRIMDIPGERSSHARPVPKSGGVAIVAAFVIAALIIYFIADIARIDDRHFWGFLVTALLIAIVSFVDDINQKSFFAKVGTQMLCVLVMLAFGVVVTRLWIPVAGEVYLGWVGYVLTFLWIIGLTNAYNFMDGLDGLAAGVALIAAVFLCAIAISQLSLYVYVTSYALIASVAGFLVFNFPPAKIFMGDVGSAFIGFAFATLAVIGANLDFGHLSFYVVPMLLFQFIFDTVVTFARRLLAGEKVYLAHRTHLYQLLNRMGYSHRTVSLFHYAVAVAQGMGAFALVGLEPRHRVLAFIPFLAFNTLYAYWVLRRARAMQLV